MATRALATPQGFRSYETMLVLRPDLDEETRVTQLAKIESWLSTEGAVEVNMAMKGTQRLAYPMNGCWEGFMVFTTFLSSADGVRTFEKKMSTPDSESQGNILRWSLMRT